MDRRQFLKSGAAFIGASAFIPPVFQKALWVRQQQGEPGGLADGGRALVVVQLAGGNDGLNTVVPVTDGLYYDARRGLSVSQSSALPLNSTTGLHPAMSRIKELWDQGSVAVVEGVGYSKPNFSHFVSMDIWQTADPELKLADGWLGRYFERNKGGRQAPFPGLAIGGTLPTSFSTPAVAVPSVGSIGNYQFQSDLQVPSIATQRLAAMLSLYGENTSGSGYADLLHKTIQSAVASTNVLQDANSKYKTNLQYESNSLASALRLAVATIAADIGVKVFHVTIGGFDTHANQLVDQPRQLGILSTALYTFYSDLKAKGLDSKVLIMTWSEFGRRVKSNASQGTDHGTAAPVFFIGTPVKGGLYGQRPSLGNLDDGNLRYTVDFRSVYATALESWLGVSSRDVLDGNFETIPLLK